MVVQPLGDCAYAVTLEGADSSRAAALAEALRREPRPGQTEVVAAYATVAVYFRREAVPTALELEHHLVSEWGRLGVPAGDAPRPAPREIPVLYGGEVGPDLPEVATHARLSVADVVRLHAGADYQVEAIGFLPGFPYLSGLAPELACPRRPVPRTAVPAGSVGIGGSQTGVYPCASPGGWNLIGRTPLRLFDPEAAHPALLRAGDRVRFTPAAAADFPVPGAIPPPAGRPALHVLRAGPLTTVQDLGRSGWRFAGVGPGGAADEMAARVANAIVGNPEDAAGLEFTLSGPELRFERETWVAVGGGDFSGLPSWIPFCVKAGTTLDLGPARRGCRGFLAVAGGIDVPRVLGGRGAHLRAGFGGGYGRALRAGDFLPVGPGPGVMPRGRWRVDAQWLPRYESEVEVRLVPGGGGSALPEGLGREFTVSARSDRMGLRLEGAPRVAGGDGNLGSAPVVPGTVQVPPGGDPIILLADAQTLGGYATAGHVATVDLPLLAQLRAGDRVRFRVVTLEEARAKLVAREHALAILRAGLKEKLV